MCFQSTILVCEMYKLWMNEFRTISIIKLWDAKFVIMSLLLSNFFVVDHELWQLKMVSQPPFIGVFVCVHDSLRPTQNRVC